MNFKFFKASLSSIAHPKINEDTIFVDQKSKIAMVLDGVGGLVSGDKASNLAKQYILKNIKNLPQNLEGILQQASQKVLKEVPGGGTTATVLEIFESEDKVQAEVAHVGDSRCYILRAGKLTQISQDDSLLGKSFLKEQERKRIANILDQVEDLEKLTSDELFYFNKRNVITQMLGDINLPQVHIYEVKLKSQDLLILSTDGVHDNLTKVEMEKVLKSHVKDKALVLVEEAYKRSIDPNHIRAKPDDISAIIVHVS